MFRFNDFVLKLVQCQSKVNFKEAFIKWRGHLLRAFDFCEGVSYVFNSCLIRKEHYCSYDKGFNANPNPKGQLD